MIIQEIMAPPKKIIPKRRTDPKRKVTQPKITRRTRQTEHTNKDKEEEATVTMTQTKIDALITKRVAELLTAELSKEGGKKNMDSQAQGNNSRRGGLYKDFMNCKSLDFNGTEGAVGLLQWFEKVESVFRLSDCAEDSRVKYATGTFTNTALSWWTAHTNIVGIDQANNTPWEEVKEMLKGEYCPRNEIQKLERELWDLVVKGNDIAGYTRRFHELSIMCPELVTPENKRIERYIWGLPQPIQGNVIASEAVTLSSAIRLAHKLMDIVIRHEEATKTAEIKAYHIEQSSNLSYRGSKPFCNICKRHHEEPCTWKVCEQCRKTGHLAEDCRTVAPGASYNCFNCGEEGHFRRNFPMFMDQEIKTREHRNVNISR